jgi:four helix bundle suffix protein
MDPREPKKHEPQTDPTDHSDPTDPTDPTDPSDLPRSPTALRPSGGYRRLRSFQTATVIYDATVSFCQRHLDKRSRTVDQMVQAARSGRQNIAEGSRASATSSQTELRLVNVARASLDELLLDFEDYLRQHHCLQWKKNDPEARAVREVGRTGYSTEVDARRYSPWLRQLDPAVMANAIICLIHQANFLLDQQIAGLERQFIQEGGYSERLAAARIAERQRQNRTDRTDRSDPTDRSNQPAPDCPLCGKTMRQRTARRGKHAGSPFWGCSGYPDCQGTRPFAGKPASN